MNTLRKIIHVDMDAFFASIEQRDNPELLGKPVIVGGKPNSRGVVAACSYEAREFGVRSAMPCAKAHRLCPDAIFVRPRMTRYREISAVIMTLFHQFTDLVEPLSVDEAFLDVTVNKKNNPSASLLAKEICAKIYTETKLTASAGVSCNKFLAKVSSDMNKPNGITVITPGEALHFLDELPVRKFFGVGPVTEKKMKKLGITNGKILRTFSREKLINHFGKSGSFFYDIVRGHDNRPVQAVRARKSIGNETTFHEDIIETDTLYSILQSLASRIEETLQKKKMHGFTLTLKVRYHDFTTVTRSVTSSHQIRTKEDIMELVPRLVQATEAGRKAVRLLGLSLSKLQDNNKATPVQLRLPFTRIPRKS